MGSTSVEYNFVAISSVIIALIISLMDLGFDTILGEFYTIF